MLAAPSNLRVPWEWETIAFLIKGSGFDCMPNPENATIEALVFAFPTISGLFLPDFKGLDGGRKMLCRYSAANSSPEQS